MRNYFLLVGLAVSLPQLSLSQTPPQPPQVPSPKPDVTEFNTILMEATFEIQSAPVPGQPSSLGTAFIIGRPFIKQPNWSRYVLVTAAHVLDGMAGNAAILNLRKQTQQGVWQKLPVPLQIRNNGQPLWLKHPNADVAVMYVSLPDGVSIPLMSTAMLADDEMLKKFQVHPGDTLVCLGYPFGIESSQSGFPVLRSEKIASFPLTPTAEIKTFLFDFAVFEGNSGGPVYMVDRDREYERAVHMGETIGFVAGLVSAETTGNEQLYGKYSAEIRRIPLNLATVVHASFIKEAINMLPSPGDLPQTPK